MRGLLRDMPPGVPADCLLARIRGRRSFLVRDWDRQLLSRQPLASLAAAPWRQDRAGAEGWPLRALQQEYFWAFSRMDEPLRRATAPFFWLAEVHTLAVCLRLLTVSGADLSQQLQSSLLVNPVRDLLRKAADCSAAVTYLAALLARHDNRFAVLADIYRSGGPGLLEAALYEISLQILAHGPGNAAMRCYIALLIDSRNLVTIAKRLRWRLTSLPQLLNGGTIPLPQLTELFVRRDSAALLHRAMRLGGEASYDAAADLERVLFEAQARVMHRLACGDEVGTILDYLWRCGNEAANIGLLERLEQVGSDTIARELRR
jgi:hypothetical protein